MTVLADGDVEVFRCSHCREVKPVTAFHRDRANRRGLHHWCRSCRAGREAAQWATMVVATVGVPAVQAAALAKSQSYTGSMAELAEVFWAAPTFALTGWWADGWFNSESPSHAEQKWHLPGAVPA